MTYLYDDDEDDWDIRDYRSRRKYGKPLGPNDPHYPNKAERVLLTQMMQKSGQTEEQVRAEKSNRQKLAAARKSMSDGKGCEHRYDYLLKQARRQTAARLGVPVWDPKITTHFNNIISQSRGISVLQRIRRLK